MHIVEIPSFFPPYGGEFCLEQSKALARRGHKVSILANVQLSVRRSMREFLTMPYGKEILEMEGVRVERRYMRGLPKSARPNAERWVRRVERMFDEYVEANGVPDIIHAHCAKWGGQAAMIISKRYHIPYVVTEHLSYEVFASEFTEHDDAWQIPVLKRVYAEADMVVTVSDELVDNLSPLFGKDYRHTTISNTVDTEFFKYKPRVLGDGHTFTFCCLANFWPLKRYDVLLEAFSRLPEDTSLLIAGRGTDNRDFRALLSKYPCASRVKALGRIEKPSVRDVLYASDCLVLASESESQGLCLVEAMSTGIETIATDAIPQNVSRYEGCHTVPVGDVKALAEQMKAVMSVRNVDGRQLSEAIDKDFSPQVIGEKLENLFLEIKNRRAES